MMEVIKAILDLWAQGFKETLKLIHDYQKLHTVVLKLQDICTPKPCKI